LLLRWLNSPPPAASSYATLFFTHVFTFAETKFRRAKVGQFNGAHFDRRTRCHGGDAQILTPGLCRPTILKHSLPPNTPFAATKLEDPHRCNTPRRKTGKSGFEMPRTGTLQTGDSKQWNECFVPPRRNRCGVGRQLPFSPRLDRTQPVFFVYSEKTASIRPSADRNTTPFPAFNQARFL
jgi:hypothetical protein